MQAHRRIHVMASAGLTVAVAVSTILLGGNSTAVAKSAAANPPTTVESVKVVRSTRTAAVEARRVASVKTPKLRWYSCYGHAQCATAKLPRDYDRPTGAKVEVALLRVKARDQRRKVGSLFVNPGGPGGSGTELAYYAPYIFGEQILERFDVVGMDPRGTNFSDQVACFPSHRQQTPVLTDLSIAFPYTKAEEARYVKAAKKLGKACSTTGKPLSASMSTAEVARDMEVLRRAVGDKKLSYLGFSYGSYLGQVYANMFPDRFRALAIDGVLDPVAWAGTEATKNQPQTDRLRSADGATKALHEILVRCDRAGGARCAFAPGDPVANFDLIAERLKKHPIVDVDPFTAEQFTFGYADLVWAVLGSLYRPEGYDEIVYNLAQLIIITEPPAKVSVASFAGPRTTTTRAAAMKRLVKSLARAEKAAQPTRIPGRSFGFPYDNSLDAFASVLCTDSVNPANASSWPAAARAADRRAKYFGRAWIWLSPFCASNTWTAKDEDAYRGPFNRTTAAPVLVVGNIWDPATNYAGAVKAASLLGNSRLLSSDSWGHTAYGTSSCVTNAVEKYLLKATLPARGKRCVGDIQPFQGDPDQGETQLQKFIQPVAPIDIVTKR